MSELRDCSSVESFEIKDFILRSPKLAEWIFLDPEVRLRMRMCIDRMYPAELADIPWSFPDIFIDNIWCKVGGSCR